MTDETSAPKATPPPKPAAAPSTPVPGAANGAARFSTAEVSFFNTGEQIESGQVILPEATSGEGGRIKRWVRHSPGLVAGFGCAVLVVVGFWIGSGHGRSDDAPGETLRPAALVVPVRAGREDAPPAAAESDPAAETSPAADSPVAHEAQAPRSAKAAGRGAAAPLPHQHSRRPAAHSFRR